MDGVGYFCWVHYGNVEFPAPIGDVVEIWRSHQMVDCMRSHGNGRCFPETEAGWEVKFWGWGWPFIPVKQDGPALLLLHQHNFRLCPLSILVGPSSERKLCDCPTQNRRLGIHAFWEGRGWTYWKIERVNGGECCLMDASKRKTTRIIICLK